jgi:hypothetical protein
MRILEFAGDLVHCRLLNEVLGSFFLRQPGLDFLQQFVVPRTRLFEKVSPLAFLTLRGLLVQIHQQAPTLRLHDCFLLSFQEAVRA